MSLTQEAANGVRWSTLSMALVSIIQIIRLLVLGRMPGPASFGLLAMMVVIGFAQLIGQMGMSQAIIQRPDPTQTELSTLYWLNIGIGGLLYAIVLLVTPLIAALYSTSELMQMLPWAALGLVL
jgi:lipopolysaccharide exporter